VTNDVDALGHDIIHLKGFRDFYINDHRFPRISW